MKRGEIKLRDPFVLPYEGKYYLYGTRSETAFVGQAYGFDVYVSGDLEEWEGPFEAFHRPDGFWSRKSYWAPEVHLYRGRFYMFATFGGPRQTLGTAVLAADSPMGPFSLWSNGYVTPKEWRCLDGTLYLSRKGIPYLVFCHEWRQIRDGAVCALPLTEDLSAGAGQPFVLFSASQARPFVKKYLFRNYVTDGPFLLRTPDNSLHLLWSTYARTGYVEALAHSDSQEIDGDWQVDETPLYDRDGGHGMIFRDLAGMYRLALHTPNTFGKERPVFLPLNYHGGRFAVVDAPVGLKEDAPL